MDLQGQQSTQETLFSLEELTLTKTSSIERIKEDLKTARKMIKDGYANSQAYVSQENLVKGEKAQLIDIKKEIDNIPAQKTLLEKAKELAKELKEKELEVSDYALQYEQMAGKSQIDKDGVTYDIVKSAKLVKRLQ